MAGNSFGNIFKLTTFGESHGLGIGGVIDGCPSGVKIDLKMIQNDFRFFRNFYRFHKKYMSKPWKQKFCIKIAKKYQFFENFQSFSNVSE